MSLGFAEQWRWLAGRLPDVAPVPLDRTPPLSYWVGSLWVSVFGPGIMAARCLSVALSAGSILTLHRLARRSFGQRPALVSAALLALSPNFLVEAVEIRAYAALILSSVLLLGSYLRLLAVRPEPSRGDLWTFALTATLCSYAHYFGVLISAGTCACVLAAYLKGDRTESLAAIMRRAKWPVFFYLLCVAALVPLLISAFRLSATPGGGGALGLATRVHDALRLVYRLFSHQSMLGITGLSAVAAMSGLTLAALAGTRGADPRARQVLLMLAVNLTLVGLIGIMAHAFDAFTPSYSSWTLPLLALLGGSVLRHGQVWARRIGVLCLIVLLLADGYGAARLATMGEIYAHTRSTALQHAVNEAGPGNASVLYLDDAAATYFALQYYFRGRLPQYITVGDGLRPIGAPPGGAAVRFADLGGATLIIARDQQLSAEELESLNRHKDTHTGAYRALDEFLRDPPAELATRWVLVSRQEYLAQSALAFAVLRRRPAGS